MKRLAAIIIMAICCTSCATILCGSTERVVFDSDYKKPVTAVVDGYRHRNVKFPFRVDIKRGLNKSHVKFIAEGCNPEEIVVDKVFNWVSILNLAEPLGWVIDLASGAITKPAYERYWVDLTPLLPEYID